MKVTEKFQHIIDVKFPFLRSAKLYLAISGGKDSMALSHLLLQCGVRHTLLHCNFQLRGKESDADEQFLCDYAKKNQLEIHVKHFDTAALAEERKQTIQECARNLRYEWFRTFLEGDANSFLLTAHHLDDSIETFFINLFRGTGYRGLSGIPVNANRIVRPLSEFTSDEIYRYIDAFHIDYRSDSSNAKRDYLRNKIRLDLIPVVTEIEPDFRQKFVALFEELSDLKNLIDEQVEKYKNDHENRNNDQIIYELDGLIACDRIFLEQLFRQYGVHRKNSGEFHKFLRAETGSKFNSREFDFLIDRNNLIITKGNQSENSFFVQVEKVPVKVVSPYQNLQISSHTEFTIIKGEARIQQVDQDKINFPVTIRTWQQGDKIKPLGMTGTKLISDILIDRKVNLKDKEKQWVVLDSNGELICLIGHVVSEDVKITPDTKQVLQLEQIA